MTGGHALMRQTKAILDTPYLLLSYLLNQAVPAKA